MEPDQNKLKRTMRIMSTVLVLVVIVGNIIVLLASNNLINIQIQGALPANEGRILFYSTVIVSVGIVFSLFRQADTQTRQLVDSSKETSQKHFSIFFLKVAAAESVGIIGIVLYGVTAVAAYSYVFCFLSLLVFMKIYSDREIT